MPGSGKSALRSHLVADHGYFDVSFNGEDSIAPEDTLRGGLRQRFTAAVSTGDARPLVKELNRISGGIVAEWGFPIDEPCLDLARSIRENGLPVVWLECPDAVARERFVARGTVPEADFDVQVGAIRANYEAIMTRVEPVVVEVVTSDGRQLTTPEAYEAIREAL